MGLLSRWRDRRPVDLDQRSPELGLKMGDMLVLEQLIQAGADMSKPRHVVYYLYFGDPAEAAAAGTEATDHGFTTEVRDPVPEYPNSWTLVCERHDYVLSLDAVRDNSDLFDCLADRHGGEYDGWEASV